jgi:uncharacterized protein DUF222
MSQAQGWLPDDLALIPAGPGLAAVLAEVDRAGLSDQDLVRLAQARQRLAAHVQAQLLADVHAMRGRTDEILGADEQGRRGWAECEVGFALTWTRHAAGWQLSLAEELIDHLPAVFVALDSGDIDLPRATVFVMETMGLEQEVAGRVVEQLIGEASRLTSGQLRARLRRLVIAADPGRAARTAKEQVTRRRVMARLSGAGTAEVAGYDLPPHRVAAAMQRLTAIARAAKSGGDARRLDQLRADALLDLLVGEGVATGGPVSATGGPDAGPGGPVPTAASEPEAIEGDDSVDPDQEELAALWDAGFDQLPASRPSAGCPTCGPQASRGVMPGPRKGVVDIQVALSTLLGLTDFPAELAGYGPVIADIARQVAAEQTDATWRFSVYDPLGNLIHHGITKRRPRAEDVAFVRARDKTCRAPGCRMPARRCDVDHTEDWAYSQDSRRCNLACYCRRHHLFKHLQQSGLIQLTPGVLGLSTPLGQYLVTHPEPHLDELQLTLLNTSSAPT